MKLSKSVVSSQWSVANAVERALKATDYELLTTDSSKK